MKSGQRHEAWRWSVILHPILISLTLCCLFSFVDSRWCTVVEAYQQVKTKLEPSKCNQSYQDSCGWFSSKQCMFYEVMDCVKEKNFTITRYRMKTVCCQGFKLNPLNNITCIEDSGGIGGAPGQEDPTTQSAENNEGENRGRTVTETKVVKLPKPQTQANNVKEAVSGGGTVASSTPSSSLAPVRSEDGDYAIDHPQLHHETETKSDNIFLSLSSGAYTGIICAFVLLLCILVLIGLHLWKKQRRLKEKVSQKAFEMGATQKMLSLSTNA